MTRYALEHTQALGVQFRHVVVRVEDEAFCFVGPAFDDVLERRESTSPRSVRIHRSAIDRPLQKRSCQDRSYRLTFRAWRHERRMTTRQV